MPPTLEEKLRCFGYYGFGGGVAKATDVEAPDAKDGFYCTSCPLAQKCWEEHKARLARLFPEVVKEFEEMAKLEQGVALCAMWKEKYGVADPYSLGLLGNLEDGIMVARGEGVMWRGKATIPWPFGIQN